MFRIGQRVVCVKNHSKGLVKAGQQYTVNGVNFCCKPLVDVGVFTFGKAMNCCGKRMEGNINWFSTSLFAPIEEISETTYDEVMEKISEGNLVRIERNTNN